VTPDENTTSPTPAEVDPSSAGEEVELGHNAGSILFNEGDASEYAYLIIEGGVTLTKEQDEVSVQLAELGVGDIFGEMGVLDGSPRSATAVTKDKVLLRRYDRDALLARIHGDAAFALPIMNQLVSKLRETSDKLAHNQFLTMKEAAENTDIALHPKGIIARLRVFFDADQDINEFQPDAVEIELRRMPGVAVVMLFAILGLLVTTVLWASLTYIDTKVMAMARLITTQPNIVLQPLETAVIRTMNAKVGDVVKTGDILATLDPTFAEADVSASRAALMSLEAQGRRLETALYGLPIESFSSDPAIDALEKEVFNRQKLEVEDKVLALEQQVNQIGAQIRTNFRDAEGMAGQVAILQEIEAMRLELMTQGHGSRVNYLMAKNQGLAIEREQRLIKTSTEQLRHRLKAAKADIRSFMSERRSKLATELVQVRRRIDEVTEQLKKMEKRSKQVEITAPAAGVVLEIAERTVGSVVRSAEQLFTIVPTNVPIELEADIDPKDVGQLQLGDLVRIKLDTLPFQKHGMLTGIVRLIGEDTVEKDIKGKPAAVYNSRIEITGDELRNVPASFHLMAGMTASAEITVGKRRVITYFLYPIIRTISTSFREP